MKRIDEILKDFADTYAFESADLKLVKKLMIDYAHEALTQPKVKEEVTETLAKEHLKRRPWNKAEWHPEELGYDL